MLIFLVQNKKKTAESANLHNSEADPYSFSINAQKPQSRIKGC